MALAKLIIASLVVGLIATPAIGEDIINVDVFNNEVRAEIELASGIQVDVTVGFEQATGLDATSIGLTAELIDPLDPALLSRFPGSLVSPLSAFPLLLKIEPPEEGTLSFLGVATVGLHTHNLGYTVASPFRLVVADDGGEFYDITDQAGSGSYRVRGSRGEFSEFMIVADLRSVDDVIDEKFDWVENILTDNQNLVNSTLHSGLLSKLAAAQNAYNADDTVLAIRTLDEFMRSVRSSAGGAIPNLWRSRDDIVNLDGQLRAAASTLRYSLTLLANDLP